MDFWITSSAAYVTGGTRKKTTDCAFRALDVARGGTACCQIALRSLEDFSIENIEIDCAAARAEAYFVDPILFNDGIPYPDRLAPVSRRAVKAHVTQSVWVSFFVPRDACPGAYGATVVARTSEGDCAARVLLTVRDALVPAPKDAALYLEYFLNPYGSFPADAWYSDAWWAFIKELARATREMRINVLCVGAVRLLADAGSRRASEDTWSLRFDYVDRYIEAFLAEGHVKSICVSAEIKSVTGGDIGCIDGDGKTFRLPLGGAEGEAWAKAFYGGVYAHFAEKGWLGMLRMHLQDEPHDDADWLRARNQARKYMPGVPCGEPLDTHAVSLRLAGACDTYVPRLEVFEEGEAFYRSRKAAGDAIWAYSCCFPEDVEHLNRFIDRPHVQTRLILWACFAQGIEGFLHWGFNHWAADSLYGLNPAARFKGDGFVVYPDGPNLRPSARYMASVEGAEEYELLALAAKHHPEEALALARSVARSFHEFTEDPDKIDAARASLMALAEVGNGGAKWKES